jgi:hypothetical protein
MANDLTLSFGLPEGRLPLNPADLSLWAQHLARCCQILDLAPGSTIGMVDFGTSPLAFLASRLLTPLLPAGLAELFPARIICLDASRERVALVPSILRQVRMDALFVRAEVLPALLAYASEADVDLTGLRIVVAHAPDARDPIPDRPFLTRLWLAEAAMLMAPLCPVCGAWHLDRARYALTEGGILTLGLGVTTPLPPSIQRPFGPCAAAPDDILLIEVT